VVKHTYTINLNNLKEDLPNYIRHAITYKRHLIQIKLIQDLLHIYREGEWTNRLDSISLNYNRINLNSSSWRKNNSVVENITIKNNE